MEPIGRSHVEFAGFNQELSLPYELRVKDFDLAIQDVYDFFFDVNSNLLGRGLKRLDDLLRPAAMSGFVSDMLTASLANHARSLTENRYHNGHPDLSLKASIPRTVWRRAKRGLRSRRHERRGGAVDFHGARDQWLCVFVYETDHTTEPARARRPMAFTEVYLGYVTVDDFRRNERGELGTRTATLDRDGIRKFRLNWLYRGADSVDKR